MEKILKILEENARISLEDIATMVESTPEEVAKQIDAYQQAHVINGYKALIDWDKAGADRVQAIIELRVSPKRDCGFDEVAANIARFDEVDSVMLMTNGSCCDGLCKDHFRRRARHASLGHPQIF